MIKNDGNMKVRIAKERSDLCDLTAAAIKATYNTRNPCEVERCIDVLNHLKSLSLSVKDIRLSKSIVKLETLRSHRNLRIRKEAQALFHSWLKTFYAHGSDNSFKAALTKDRLKMKKHILTRCSELKNKENERSQMTVEAVESKTTIKLWELNRKEDQRSLTRETEKNKPRNNFLALNR
ncbi:putative transcription factor IIS, TFIIS/LEDGF domain superfamily [Arabidopsis thaliana]